MSWYHIDIGELDSTLISEADYNSDSSELTIFFKKTYNIKQLTYIGVPYSYWDEFTKSKSFGMYYLSMIKPNFSLKNTKKMADKFIKLKINVREINKEWLFVGEKGTYANLTLMYNEEEDSYGNNGMIVQDVPKKVYEEEKSLPKEKRTKGPILGNAKVWGEQSVSQELKVGEESGKLGAASNDDLPF